MLPHAFVALLAVAAVAAGAPATGRAASPGDTLGAYTGSGNPGGVTQFGQRLGRTLPRAHDYLDRTSWSTMLNVGWMADRWVTGGYGNRMVITVPMFPESESGSDLLARGADGDFNAHFETLAQRLVANGLGAAVLRLGHEFNGTWYKWSIAAPNGGANYAAYWRQIVDTMRSVAGTNFTFDWSPNADSSWVNGAQLQASDGWPGIGYVDYVGLSVYDQSWIPNHNDPAARWNAYVHQKNGLAWQAAFAASKGKRITFPEWALVQRPDGHGGGDSPYFIQQMHNWIATHDVAYHLYFEFRDHEGQFGIFSGAFPNAAASFVALFGPGAGSAPAAPSPSDLARFANLCIERARISARNRKLKLLATIAPHASGSARVDLHAGGRKQRFSKTIDRGTLRLSRKLSRRQARKGTGIVTITYRGNPATKAQRVRLRIAPRRPRLQVGTAPLLAGGRIFTHGTVSRRARGVVRVRLEYETNGRSISRHYKARIRKGRWQLSAPLSALVRTEIANRRGEVHAYVLYTGSEKRLIGGQMKTYQVLGYR